MPPELLRELDEETERIIDDWVEQKHAHEVVQGDELEEEDDV